MAKTVSPLLPLRLLAEEKIDSSELISCFTLLVCEAFDLLVKLSLSECLSFHSSTLLIPSHLGGMSE